MAKRKTAEMEKEMAKRKMVAEMENERAAEQKEVLPLGKGVSCLISEMRRIPDGAKVKDAFLWELLRNAQTAIVRARAEGLVDEKIHFPDSEIFIHIVPDKKNGTLTIIDNGAGLTKRELDLFLGRQIVHETEHQVAIREYATTRSDVDLSPLYLDDRLLRLGFHSAYMVADRVKVTTKATGDHDQYVWDSDGFDSYTIARDTASGERLKRGTKVTLFLNDNHVKYADERILHDLIKKYVGRLRYPIHILVDDEGKKTMKEIVDDEKQKKERLPIERLRIKFEGLRKKFEKFLGDRVDKVVVSDRLFELPGYLSTDRRTFVINPRSNMMEKLRRKADKEDCDEDEMEYLVEEHFWHCTYNIKAYDFRHGTSFWRMISPTQRVGLGRHPSSLAYIKKIEEKKRKKKEMKKKGQRNSLLGTKEKTNSGTSTVKSM